MAPDRPERWRWVLLVLEAMAWLVVASLAVRALPFRILAARLGPARAAGGVALPADPVEAARARRVGRAVERAAQRLPWHPVCLPQALAAKGMLACRGLPTRLHLGVVPRSPGLAAPGLAAHAWLTLGDATVVGGRGRAGFTEVARFG